MHSKQLLGSTGFNNSLFWRGQRHWAVYPEIPMNHLTRAFVNWSSWWFQTFEKYKSKWESSPNRSENKKYLKPPTSGVFLHCFFGPRYLVKVEISQCQFQLIHDGFYRRCGGFPSMEEISASIPRWRCTMGHPKKLHV